MGPDRFLALTNEQKDCLRLVAQGFTSKQIARQLGVHYRTIDQRLDRVRKLINEPDRPAAARAFSQHEQEMRQFSPGLYPPVPASEPPVLAAGPLAPVSTDPAFAALANDVEDATSGGIGSDDAPSGEPTIDEDVMPLAYDAVIYDTRSVAVGPARGDEGAGTAGRVREAGAIFGHFPQLRPRRFPYLLPFDGRCPDDVPPVERLAFILRLSAWVPMSLGALWLGLILLMKLLWGAGFNAHY
jgi:DNA-binding CsgD family transcriptional regulator